MRRMEEDYNYYRSYSMGSYLGALMVLVLVRSWSLLGPVVFIVSLARLMGELSNYREFRDRKYYIYIIGELVVLLVSLFLIFKNF